MMDRSLSQALTTPRFRVVTGSGSAPRRFNWLILSVAANLLFVGLIVAWIVAMPGPRRPLVTWQLGVLPSLNEADAAIVTNATDRIIATQDAADDAVHADYGRIRALLAADPLDQAALEQSVRDIATIRGNAEVAMRQAFFEELTALSTAGRARMLTAMEKESRRGRRHAGH